MSNMIRLQKAMADKWVASRRKSEEYILAWNVKVNWKVVTVLWTKVDPSVDIIEVDWKALKKQEEALVYYVLNKPAWYVSTTHRTRVESDMVVDLVPKDKKVYPVWRLDKDTTGLILITNDWDLTYKLTHPSFEHEKEYEVLVDRKISDKDLNYLWSWAIVLFWKQVQKTSVERRSARSFSIILREWMNRQIRRMVRSIGMRVEKLRRIRMGSLQLWDLPVWEYRRLSLDEVKKLSL